MKFCFSHFPIYQLQSRFKNTVQKVWNREKHNPWAKPFWITYLTQVTELTQKSFREPFPSSYKLADFDRLWTPVTVILRLSETKFCTLRRPVQAPVKVPENRLQLITIKDLMHSIAVSWLDRLLVSVYMHMYMYIYIYIHASKHDCQLELKCY